jgi:hypothetical protein
MLETQTQSTAQTNLSDDTIQAFADSLHGDLSSPVTQVTMKPASFTTP